MRLYYCPHCGAELVDQARFCSHCGGEIAWEQQPTPKTDVEPEAVVADSATSMEIAAVVASSPTPLESFTSAAVVEPLVMSAVPEVDSTQPPANDVVLPIPENIAAVISYLTLIPAVIFLYLDPFKRNRFVRFHAIQHLLLFGTAVASFATAAILWMILQLIPFMRVLVFPFAGLIGLAWLFLWLLLLVKAYHHEMFKLPWIGDYAEEWSRI